MNAKKNDSITKKNGKMSNYRVVFITAEIMGIPKNGYATNKQ